MEPAGIQRRAELARGDNSNSGDTVNSITKRFDRRRQDLSLRASRCNQYQYPYSGADWKLPARVRHPRSQRRACQPTVAAKPASCCRNQHNISLNPGAPKYNVTLIGQRNVGNGLDFYSLDREVALGRQLSQEVEASARLVKDPVINEYINRIGQNLVRNSDARVPFTIRVLDTEEVNAFALPGRVSST